MTYAVVVIMPKRLALAYDENNIIVGTVRISADGKTYRAESDDPQLPLAEMLEKLEFGK